MNGPTTLIANIRNRYVRIYGRLVFGLDNDNQFKFVEMEFFFVIAADVVASRH